MNLGADYKGFSLTAQLSASWGGYSFVDASALKSGSGVDDLEFTNMPSFWNVDNMYSYQDIYDAAGNLVVAANRNGSLPNLAYQSVNAITSSFWRISGTRVKLSRLTLAYTIPSSLVKKIGIQSARVNVMRAEKKDLLLEILIQTTSWIRCAATVLILHCVSLQLE